jgi:hypothetical protein
MVSTSLLDPVVAQPVGTQAVRRVFARFDALRHAEFHAFPCALPASGIARRVPDAARQAERQPDCATGSSALRRQA